MRLLAGPHLAALAALPASELQGRVAGSDLMKMLVVGGARGRGVAG